jgi:hypothetical protein
MAYTLSINGAAAVSLSSLNATNASLTENINGETSLELTCSQSFDSANICPAFGKVILYDDTNTIRFVGWLDKASRDASADSHSASYVFNGALRWLERSYYTQNRAGVILVGGTAGSGTTFPAESFAKIYNSIMQSGGASFNYQPQATVSGIYNLSVPSRLRSDVTASDALQTLLQFTPTACLRWTYPSSTPFLNLLRTDETIDGYIDSATHQLVSAGLTPRYDLLADSIIVFFMRDDEVVGSSTYGPQFGQGTGGTAGALGAARRIVITYDVSVINNLPSTGLAQVMSVWYQRLHIDGSVEKYVIDWNDYAGQLLGFSGSLFSAFSAYNSLLKSITRDLLKGTTQMDLGVYPARTIYKVGDYDTPATGTPEVINNQPFSAPATGIAYGAPNFTTFNPDGFSTGGSVDAASVLAGIAEVDSLTVTGTSDLQGLVTVGSSGISSTGDISSNGSIGAQTDIAAQGNIGADGTIAANGDITAGGNITADGDITAEGKINANETPVSVEAAATIKSANIEISDTTSPITIGTITYKELQIERCDGKKVKILADSAGWV